MMWVMKRFKPKPEPAVNLTGEHDVPRMRDFHANAGLAARSVGNTNVASCKY